MPIANHLTPHAMQNTPAYHNECLINSNRCICKLKRKGWEGEGLTSLTWNSCFSVKEVRGCFAKSSDHWQLTKPLMIVPDTWSFW